MRTALMTVVLAVFVSGCTFTTSVDWIPQDKQWTEVKKSRTEN